MLLLSVITPQAYADCPAAPIADPNDMAISFLVANGIQAASASLLPSSVKEGTLVYDGTVDKLKICDGTSWATVGVGITALTGDVAASGTGSVIATIANNAVNYAKIQNTSAASVLLGRGAGAGAGIVQELTIGSGLSLSGTTLSATGGGTVTGTTGKSARFTTASTVGNGAFFDDGTNAGMGLTPKASTTSPLQINGDISLNLSGSATALHMNSYYDTGWKAYSPGFSGALRFDSTSGQLQFWTSPASVAADAASNIAQRMTILPNGNVGIGTTMPGYPLTVAGSSGQTTQLALTAATSSFANNILITNVISGNTLSFAFGSNSSRYAFGTTTNQPFALFSNNGLDQFVVMPGGDVGIGGTITSGTLTGSSMVVKGSGKVGIGTTIPIGPLTIVSSGSTGGEDDDLSIRSYSSTSANGAPAVSLLRGRGTSGSPSAVLAGDGLGDLWFGGYRASIENYTAHLGAVAEANFATSAATALTLSTHNGTAVDERMRITGAGSVGIGTITPGFSNIVGRTYLTIKGSTNAGVLELMTGATDADQAGVGVIQFSDINTTATTEKRVAAIAGTLDGATANLRGGALRFLTRGNNTDVAIPERMRIDNTGNVGIGTTSPAYKLDVNGDIITRGWLRTTGAAGWYSETYGGGWYMTDSTWVRAYNGKSIYTPANILAGGYVQAGHFVDDDSNYYADLNSNSRMNAIYANLLATDTRATDCGGGWTCTLYAWDASLMSLLYTNLQQRSDRRLKTHIEPLAQADMTKRLFELQPVSYEWKDATMGKGVQYGFIAQDVQKVWPELIQVGDDEQATLSMSYTNLIGPVVQALKDMKAANENQAEAIEELRREIQALKAAR